MEGSNNFCGFLLIVILSSFVSPTLCQQSDVKIVNHFDPFYNELPNLSRSLVKIIDDFLPTDALDRLNKDSIPFEQEQDETRRWRKDWVNSVELVDPQKYCFIKGVSQVHNQSETIAKDVAAIRYSQLLPSDVYIDAEGAARFKSYVNNLHPTKHNALYKDLEKIISLAVPALEEIIHGITLPASTSTSTTPINLKGRNIQVLIAMRNLFIPKDSDSQYEGSKWHQEGLKTDEIVGSIIFYRDIKNIADAKLSIRVQLDASYENFTSFDPVISATNRLVVLPNIYEHRVEAFGSIRKMEEGDRKLITIALVNPLKRILSTGNVYPQQEEWLENGQSDLELGADLRKGSGCCKISLKDARKYYDETMRERLGVSGKGIYVHGGR